MVRYSSFVLTNHVCVRSYIVMLYVAALHLLGWMFYFSCHNTVLMLWYGLRTQSSWSGLGKHQETCFSRHDRGWRLYDFQGKRGNFGCHKNFRKHGQVSSKNTWFSCHRNSCPLVSLKVSSGVTRTASLAVSPQPSLPPPIERGV